MSEHTADVLVIGGGITGTSTAYQIALRGHKVILLEKDQLGAGSTGLTGGIIRQHYSNEITARMALRSLQVWRDFDNVVGGEVGWVNTGALFIAGPGEAAAIEGTVDLMRSVGITVDLLDAQAIHEIAPYLAVDDIGAGAYEPDAGVADGWLSVNAYAGRARELGASVHLGVPVTRILVESGHVTGVETSAGAFYAPVIVNAAGPWGKRLAHTVGFDTPAEVSRHGVSVFHQPPDALPPHHPTIGDFVQGFYMRSETGRLTLAGSIEAAEAQNIVDPDNYSQSVDMDFNVRMAEHTEHRIPGMQEARVGKGWAGLYTVTPDWHPIIGHMPGLEGFICAFGFSGSGFKMGPVVGEMVADLALGENKCPIDPSPFRFQRFAEGDLIRGKYAYSIIG